MARKWVKTMPYSTFSQRTLATLSLLILLIMSLATGYAYALASDVPCSLTVHFFDGDSPIAGVTCEPAKKGERQMRLNLKDNNAEGDIDKERKTEDVLCPYCGKPLRYVTSNGRSCYKHSGKDSSVCKATFNDEKQIQREWDKKAQSDTQKDVKTEEKPAQDAAPSKKPVAKEAERKPQAKPRVTTEEWQEKSPPKREEKKESPTKSQTAYIKPQDVRKEQRPSQSEETPPPPPKDAPTKDVRKEDVSKKTEVRIEAKKKKAPEKAANEEPELIHITREEYERRQANKKQKAAPPIPVTTETKAPVKKDRPKLIQQNPSREQHKAPVDRKPAPIYTSAPVKKERETDDVKRLSKESAKNVQMHAVPDQEIPGMKRAYIVQDKNRQGEDRTRYDRTQKAQPRLPDEDAFGKTQLLEDQDAGDAGFPTLTRLSTGEIVEIRTPVFRIGKMSSCHLRIPDNPVLSRLHAEILKKNGTCYVRDLSSTNGTFVGNLRLPEETEVEIKDQQVLRFADEEFRFTAGS